MKTYLIEVSVDVENDVDFNDAVGGLCDIIRDGLMCGKYEYLEDIRVGDCELVDGCEMDCEDCEDEM